MTPLLKINDFYIKREDKNPTGSAKDRAIVAQVKTALLNKYKSATISSTGNAAISASFYCQKENIPLHVFVSPDIAPNKLAILNNNHNNTVYIDPRPISTSFKQSKESESYLLRQATDPVALKAYSQIGTEIKEQLPQVTSIFIPTGSGATLLGLSKTLPQNCKIIACQSAANPTLAKFFDKNYTPEKENPCDALTVKTLPLKDQIIDTIKKSKGTALALQKDEIEKADNVLKKNKVTQLSLESALALSGLYKARKLDPDMVGDYPLILCTGMIR